MPRTRQEIRSRLDSLVGQSVAPVDGWLQGQCVSLIKDLMWYVGVSDPRKGRGNAAECGDAYIREGIGKAGQGWCTVCVNRQMAYPYGHIWIDLQGEGNWEQNGAVALFTTKNTRPLSQAQQLVNFDQWVSGGTAPPPQEDDLTPQQAQQLNEIHAWMRGTGNTMAYRVQDLTAGGATQVVAYGQLYTCWVGGDGAVVLTTTPLDSETGGFKPGGRFHVQTNPAFGVQPPGLEVLDNGAYVIVTLRHREGRVIQCTSGKWPWPAKDWPWRRLE